MSYNRFRFHLRCLRCVEINCCEDWKKTDKLAIMKAVFALFVGNSQKSVVSSPNSPIDEHTFCRKSQYIIALVGF